jgi:hypothetical protein
MRSSDKGFGQSANQSSLLGSFLKIDIIEFGICWSTWRSDCLDRNAWRAKLHIGKKSAMKQWLLRKESKHIS